LKTGLGGVGENAVDEGVRGVCGCAHG